MAKLTYEQILDEAFRLGRDLEAHRHEMVTNPPNYAGVKAYVEQGMAALKVQLRARWIETLHNALCPDGL
jgi:hypothetical protein